MGKPTRTQLPDPPKEYDVNYMRRLIMALELIIYEIQTTGHVAGSTANLNKLPTSATGLRAGDLWNDAGTVKVV